MRLTNGNLLRSGGVVLAGLIPSRRARAAVLTGSYAAGWAAGPHGFQVVSFTGEESSNPVLREGIPLASSTLSWTAAQLAVLAALRALPLPRILTVSAYAGVLAAAEPRMLAAVQRGTAAAAERAATTQRD
jgi:hypothetical protein